MAEPSIVEMSQFDINNLNSKFQNKKDLHNYMSSRCKSLFDIKHLLVNKWLPE